MSRKILLIVAILAAVGAGAYYYMASRPQLSPPGRVDMMAGDLSIAITYSRPSMRDRLIFGTKEQGALQPYGVYWRLGANKATEISFSRDVSFNGVPVKTGTYRMYAVPDADSFEIILNSALDQPGSDDPDHALDVVSTHVNVEKPDSPVEQFTILANQSSTGMDLIFEWADVRLTIPVE